MDDENLQGMVSVTADIRLPPPLRLDLFREGANGIQAQIDQIDARLAALETDLAAGVIDAAAVQDIEQRLDVARKDAERRLEQVAQIVAALEAGAGR
jgi:hypothetical protein